MSEEDFDINSYATSKSYSQAHLNTANLSMIITIMVNILIYHTGVTLSGAKIGLLVLCGTALVLQFIIFLLLTILASSSTNKITSKGCECTAVGINSTVTFLTGLLLVNTLTISIMNSTLGIYISPTNSSTGS